MNYIMAGTGKKPKNSDRISDLALFRSGTESSGMTDPEEIEKLRKYANLAEHNPEIEEKLAEWMASVIDMESGEKLFTVKKTTEGLFATAISTGTRKTVREFFEDILREVEKQTQN
jgi:hypothetical protein